jgi:urease accessory protein
VVLARALPREPEHNINASAPAPRPGARAGTGALGFRREGRKTIVSRAFAASPLRVLMPNNHGHAAWVFLASLGGGLVDGDRFDVRIDLEERAAAFVGTQASTKIYRSPHGCEQTLVVQAAAGSTIAVVPDPVVCFAGARYRQRNHFALARDASLVLLDGYTCGRGARGERWQFDLFASRTTIEKDGHALIVDACRLDPAHGPLVERMGRVDVVLSLIAIGPAFSRLREVMLSPRAAPSRGDREVVAASAVGEDAAMLRIAAERFERASYLLRPSFAALADVLGDDPFARKW